MYEQFAICLWQIVGRPSLPKQRPRREIRYTDTQAMNVRHSPH